MNVGPLNRVSGALGLVALAPTALLSATGRVSAADTAVRAAVTLVAVLLVNRATRWYLRLTAEGFERRSRHAAQRNGAATQPPVKRRSNRTAGPPAAPAPPQRRRADAAAPPPA